MYRLLTTLALGVMLAPGLMSTGRPSKNKGGLHCTLTNQVIDKCCCEKRGEKLYCTLAKKAVDTCCCEPSGTANSGKRN